MALFKSTFEASKETSIISYRMKLTGNDVFYQESYYAKHFSFLN